MSAAWIAHSATRLLPTIYTSHREPWLAVGGGGYSDKLYLVGPDPSGFQTSRLLGVGVI